MSPGRELDALIAEKVMGLSICMCDHKRLKEKHYESENNRRQNEPFSRPITHYFPFGSDNKCNTCRNLYLNVVKYSTDIAAAWEVVEKMIENGSITLSYDHGWFCGKNGSMGFSQETAPHAICLAALKIVGYEFNHAEEAHTQGL